jgi:hypothetical protein
MRFVAQERQRELAQDLDVDAGLLAQSVNEVPLAGGRLRIHVEKPPIGLQHRSCGQRNRAGCRRTVSLADRTRPVRGATVVSGQAQVH